MKVLCEATLGNMKKKHIVGDFDITLITHYNGKDRKVLYTENEFYVPTDKKLSSVSDLDGNIVEANKSFVSMTGYNKKDLIGKPYHILRHPDMPKAVFKTMWKSLKTTGR